MEVSHIFFVVNNGFKWIEVDLNEQRRKHDFEKILFIVSKKLNSYTKFGKLKTTKFILFVVSTIAWITNIVECFEIFVYHKYSFKIINSE